MLNEVTIKKENIRSSQEYSTMQVSQLKAEQPNLDVLHFFEHRVPCALLQLLDLLSTILKNTGNTFSEPDCLNMYYCPQSQGHIEYTQTRFLELLS